MKADTARKIAQKNEDLVLTKLPDVIRYIKYHCELGFGNCGFFTDLSNKDRILKSLKDKGFNVYADTELGGSAFNTIVGTSIYIDVEW